MTAMADPAAMATRQAMERDAAHKRNQKARSDMNTQHDGELDDMTQRHIDELKAAGWSVGPDRNQRTGSYISPPIGDVPVT